MSRRNKLQKFAELQEMPNFFQNFSVQAPRLLGSGNREVHMKGYWAEAHFGNANPVVLELGCGRGEYTIGLAREYLARNFIGIDIKGARIYKGARIALDNDIDNVAFLRTRIECLDAFFTPGEVDEIWVTFPDPFPRRSSANRRLTAPAFLARYRRILKPDGIVHLKTDDNQLYEYTCETVAADPMARLLHASSDIYDGELAHPALALKTYYERLHLDEGKTIKYVCFSLIIAREQEEGQVG